MPVTEARARLAEAQGSASRAVQAKLAMPMRVPEVQSMRVEAKLR